MKLDLSKNRLQQLPLDFGRLVNLQHLDLLNNRLVTLPVSFAQLKVKLCAGQLRKALGCSPGSCDSSQVDFSSEASILLTTHSKIQLALHRNSVEILSHPLKTSLPKLSACLPYRFHSCENTVVLRFCFGSLNRKTTVFLQPALYPSFLQNLKWLDLKDNPLDPVLAKVAGDCLDEKQCKQAAVKVRSLLLFFFSLLCFGGGGCSFCLASWAAAAAVRSFFSQWGAGSLH